MLLLLLHVTSTQKCDQPSLEERCTHSPLNALQANHVGATGFAQERPESHQIFFKVLFGALIQWRPPTRDGIEVIGLFVAQTIHRKARQLLRNLARSISANIPSIIHPTCHTFLTFDPDSVHRTKATEYWDRHETFAISDSCYRRAMSRLPRPAHPTTYSAFPRRSVSNPCV